MKNGSEEDTGGDTVGNEGREKELEEGRAGVQAKLALVLFPFVILLLLLFLDWWLRGRS